MNREARAGFGVLFGAAAAVAALAGCGGGDDGGQPIDAADGIDAPVAGIDGAVDADTAFALTSTAFAEGGAIPEVHTCNGANTSPILSWTSGPPGTQGYAVVLTDLSNSLVHWVIYDIQLSPEALPEDIDKVYAPPDVPGAHQTASYQAAVRGYNGPCPPSQHTYQFEVFAVDAAPLPTASMTTSRAEAITLITAHDLASATLTGTYTPP